MNDPTNDYDLQIVGGGMAGLIAANHAVDAGLRVLLLEPRTPGGRARTIERDSFALNPGPHALYRGRALDRTLRSFGIVPRGSSPSQSRALGIMSQTSGELPTSARTLLTTPLLGWRGRRQFAMFVARLGRRRPDNLASTTVADWIDGEVTDEPLRELLRGLAMLSTYCADPEVASADATLDYMRSALGAGVVYVDGGWVRIVEALVARIADRVTVSAAAAESARFDTGRWCVVDRNGHTTHSTSLLVAAGGPDTAERLFTATGLTDAAGPPVRAAVLDLGLDEPPPVDFSISTESNLYLSRHSVAADIAPDGKSLVTLARYLRGGDRLHSADSQRLLDEHARRSGIDPDQATLRRYLHRSVVAWGLPRASTGGLLGRPAVDQGGGALLAGDWVGTSGLLADACAASAAVAVEVATQRARAQRPTTV